MSGLTTHVLDISSGSPAKGVKVVLWKIMSEESRLQIIETVTNEQGRAELSPTLELGEYEICFYIGDYFQTLQVITGVGFLGKVPVRFNVTDTSEHYHVPLVTSPWAYSTYRGS